MARPVKKTPDEWRKEILDAAKTLFASKGYEETSISDIMDMAGQKECSTAFFKAKKRLCTH